MRRLFVLGVVGLGMALSANARYAVGDTPDDFTLTDWNGDSWNLYEHRGKVVLLNFGATW